MLIPTNLNQTIIAKAAIQNNSQLATHITTIFPNISANVTPLALTLRTTPAQLRALAAFVAKTTTIRATALVDIAVTDRLGSRGRFSIKYLFLSVLYNSRLVIEVYADETTSIPSLANPFFNRTCIFASAG